MHRAQIQQALEAARTISHCREFVIAGSLSVLGLLENPPPSMSMSIDIDFYPLNDPGRASDIAAVLGEGSDFHQRHGFYLDAISPLLPVLPDNWEQRLVRHNLGGVVAYFLDVNDAAISKYARGAENDLRWLEAGYEASIFNTTSIIARLQQTTGFLDREEKLATFARYRMHMLSMEPTGRLDHDLLSMMHRHGLESTVLELDTNAGTYHGAVLWASSSFVVQSLGQDKTAIHLCGDWKQRPSVGQTISLRYQDGIPHITEIQRTHSGPGLV